MMLALLLAFNIIDCGATITWVNLGVASEANPLMNLLLNLGPVFFSVTKNIMVCGGGYVLDSLRWNRLAREGLAFVTIVYGGIVFYHGLILYTLFTN